MAYRIVAGIVAVLVSTAAAAQDKKVERAWKAKCASCHGVDGAGQTETGKQMGIGDMTTAAFQKDFTDQKIRERIENGVVREKNGKQQEMKAFREVLKPEEIDGLIAYVKALKK
jgi:cytochrome c6